MLLPPPIKKQMVNIAIPQTLLERLTKAIIDGVFNGRERQSTVADATSNPNQMQ